MHDTSCNKLIAMLARGKGDEAQAFLARLPNNMREPMKVRAALAARVLPGVMMHFEKIAPWLLSTERNDPTARVRRALREAGTRGLNRSEVGWKLPTLRLALRHQALGELVESGEAHLQREKTRGRDAARFRLAEFAEGFPRWDPRDQAAAKMKPKLTQT